MYQFFQFVHNIDSARYSAVTVIYNTYTHTDKTEIVAINVIAAHSFNATTRSCSNMGPLQQVYGLLDDLWIQLSDYQVSN